MHRLWIVFIIVLVILLIYWVSSQPKEKLSSNLITRYDSRPTPLAFWYAKRQPHDHRIYEQGYYWPAEWPAEDFWFRGGPKPSLSPVSPLQLYEPLLTYEQQTLKGKCSSC